MKKNVLRAVFLTAGILSAVSLASCNDRDEMDKNMDSQRSISFENISEVKDFVQSGSFSGTTTPIILPGQSVSFTFSAGKAQHLMLATMYGASNDWFFASAQPGIRLFDDSGAAITGDVSSEIRLWDNGTKDNVSGDPESNPVATVPNVDASQLMHVSLAYNSVSSQFTVTITNTSGGTAHETPFSPGVWAVSNYNGTQLLNPAPFFTPGSLSNPEITDIAEMGNINKLKTKLDTETGIMTGLSQALVVVYNGDNPIYELGQKDSGNGLKDIAQFGNTETLSAYLKTLPNVKGVYVAGSAPIAPGQKVTANFTSDSGDKIAYVTMFGFSNDWFYANEQDISSETRGDVTSRTALFDSGTGIDQYPGAGNNQALFGGTPETEDVVISKVGDTFPVPSVDRIVKVTIN
jgi:hypothetical protein